MAELYLAKQIGVAGFEKPVVVKRILPKLCGDPAFVEMFLNEARVAARLSHPSIVQIFDLGRVEDVYFIAMEYIYGEDLRAVVEKGRQHGEQIPFGLALRIMADVLAALHYAHTRTGLGGAPLGLVHRDVSPQNVLVTYEGGVKLVDFGIAKATQQKSTLQTQAGLLKGKYAYMSPEQCNGRSVDARSDVFAAGILLWELVTGRRLFHRNAELATLVAVVDEPIPRLAIFRSDVPPVLERICSQALERNLEHRYPSAQAMQADLERLIRQCSWEADSISLANFMHERFADKLRQQEEALRLAGVGNLEDFLVGVDEGTNIAWMRPRGATPPPRSPVAGSDEAAVPEEIELDSQALVPLVQEVSGEVEIDTPRLVADDPTMMTPVPDVPDEIAAQPTQPGMPFPEEITRESVLKDVLPPLLSMGGPVTAPSRAAVQGTQPMRLPEQRTSTRRFLISAGAGLLLGLAVLITLSWWSDRRLAEQHLGETLTAHVPQFGTLHVILDRPAVVILDGQAQAPARDLELAVAAHRVHELRVRVEGEAERVMQVPPLEAGAVHTIRLGR